MTLGHISLPELIDVCSCMTSESCDKLPALETSACVVLSGCNLLPCRKGSRSAIVPVLPLTGQTRVNHYLLVAAKVVRRGPDATRGRSVRVPVLLYGRSS